ncbi:MAG: AI-2E family transporter [Clostridia bacterium]|nr:AI-2E family transporter [Clostridia bacterium]
METGGNKNLKKKVFIGAIVCAIAFLALLFVSSAVRIKAWFLGLLLILRPILIGLAVAYLLNPIFRFFERKLFKHLRPFGLRRALSLFCSILFLFLVVALLLWLIVPQLIGSMISFARNYNLYVSSAIHVVNETIESINGFLEPLTGNESVINYLKERELNEYIQSTTSEWIRNMSQQNYQPITGILGSTFSGIVDVVLGLFLTVYLLASKEKRYAQVMKLRRALFSNLVNERITRICTIADRSFGRFIKGKLIDSLIVAALIYIPLLLFGVPYALLIAAFIAITNLIPLVGFYIGMIPTAVIVLLTDPAKIIPFLIILILIQQIDSNIVSPRVLGSNTGVSSLCVLISISVAGALFGWIGMLIAVPLFATGLELLDEWTVVRLQKKGLPSGVESYYANNTLVEPEQNIHSTVDKSAQRIERYALRAQKKRENGEKPTWVERICLRIRNTAHKYHFFTEISDKSQVAVSTEEVAKNAELESRRYLETFIESQDKNRSDGTADSNGDHSV